MPGTGHSHRYKGSISNRNTKSAFQVLAPWNAKKNGEKNQVAVSTGGDNLNFKLMGAKMMSNYHKDGDNFILDCSLTVLGNKIVDGSAIIQGNVEIDGTLEVKGKVTDLSDVDICGNLRVWGKVTDLSDVDICGNLNANTGTFQGKLTNLDSHDGSGVGGIVTKYLTVTDNAYINTGDILHLVDVCDNILTLGNHNAATEEEVRGIVAKYIHANTDSSNVAFFGMDPSFNGGLVDDIHGQFVFILDVSENIGTIPADQIGGTLGRAAFGTLDISGSALYGGGGPGTGFPTQNVSDQANCQMHLVGKTIIACQTPAGGTCESAQLDISGGIDVVGPSKLTDLSGALIDISGGQVTLLTDVSGTIAVTNTQGTTTGGKAGGFATGAINISAPAGGIGVLWDDARDLRAEGGRAIVTANENAVDAIRLHSTGGTATTIQLLNDAGTGAGAIRLTSTAGGVTIGAGSLSSGVNIGAAAASSFTTSGGTLTLDGASGVNIEGGSNSNFTTTAGDIQIIGAQGVAINSTTNHVAITGADNVNIAALTNINIGGGATTVDISGATSVDISGGTTTLDAGGTLNIGPICQNIAIGNSSATVDISGSTVDISGGTSVKLTDGSGANINIASGLIHLDVNSTILGQTLGQIKLTDGSGAYIDMSGGKIDISGDHVTITGGPTSISLKSQTINIGEAGGTVDIKGNVKVDDAVTFVVKDISATNIDVSGALTVNGGRIDMSGTNTAVGTSALSSNTIGIYNVATGFQALTANTEGNHNIATGAQALTANIDGDHNVATGFQALAANDSGSDNIATGYRALFSNTSGNNNIATGTFALYPNTSGDNNVATGYQALQDNIGGSYNVATGSLALQDNIGGSYNVATGYKALYDNTDGSFNTAIGYQAGNGQTDISNTINVGYDASCNTSNTACIGNADISCVYLGSINGNAKLDCSGIVSSGLVETTDISCSSIYADGVPGTPGQVLSSTGTGIEWVDGTTVGSHWNVDSDGIHNTSGNVGIGKDSSNNVALDVSGNMAINGTINTLTVGFGTGDISSNTVVGYQALMSNTSGGDNVAIGYQALYTNDSSFNVATGAQSLFTNTTGDNNVATGAQALYYNTSGSFNVATGANALSNNTDGSGNVAVGAQALFQNNIGINNTAIGFKAGIGQTNISNTICVGNDTSCNANNTVCIGNADISCVYLGSTSGNAKLDCSGTVIGRQGITLDGSSHIPAGPGNFGIINFDGNCGRIDMSGVLLTNTSALMTMNNSAIKATSIVFASIIGEHNFGQLVWSCYIIDGGCKFYIDNPTTATFTTPGGPNGPERIQFMIINPST